MYGITTVYFTSVRVWVVYTTWNSELCHAVIYKYIIIYIIGTLQVRDNRVYDGLVYNIERM